METQDSKPRFSFKQFIIWTCALIIGLILGLLNVNWLNGLLNFFASAFTRLFQFIAVPTIALAIATTLTTLGARKNTGRIFLHTLKYTILTTLAATIVVAVLYKLIAPGNLPAEMIEQGLSEVHGSQPAVSYYGHILSVIPNNILQPFLSGNVLSILIVAAGVGLTLAILPETENTAALRMGLCGLPEVLFAMIKALVFILPVGVVAFAGQLSAQIIASDNAVGALGQYVAVIIGGNLIQFFVVLPLFLLVKGINPLKVFRGLLPAILMALFTKSSAATLPVNIECCEKNLNVKPHVARFILPICCTINMNGCAGFILGTSLFLLQNGGTTITLPLILLWMGISILSAIGNAGVPMGCYFLTLSLMSGCGAPIGIMGIILPIYAMIDMIETAINISSDACISTIVNKKLNEQDAEAQNK